ncbi:hypothetical protein [uncultured Brachybacterium sp.]|uniref:hypothetical protein n=1 Tax=uncultured Brachybacterium sp. TaxID=189680 RepID=UPI002616F344|nr:hypothetical protein [uncultured Brachybacterium sp.]
MAFLWTGSSQVLVVRRYQFSPGIVEIRHFISARVVGHSLSVPSISLSSLVSIPEFCGTPVVSNASQPRTRLHRSPSVDQG